ANAWYLANPLRYEMLRKATETLSTTPLGLLRSVLETGLARIEDLADMPDFMRAREAGLCGLTSYFAFSVMMVGAPVAVLEFFHDSPIVSGDPFARTATFAAQQLAHVFKRERAAASLRNSEIRWRSIVQSASDAIVLADAAGQILSWNKGAER